MCPSRGIQWCTRCDTVDNWHVWMRFPFVFRPPSVADNSSWLDQSKRENAIFREFWRNFKMFENSPRSLALYLMYPFGGATTFARLYPCGHFIIFIGGKAHPTIAPILDGQATRIGNGTWRGRRGGGGGGNSNGRLLCFQHFQHLHTQFVDYLSGLLMLIGRLRRWRRLVLSCVVW